MLFFYLEEPEYIINPRPQSSRCRYHNQPSFSYNSNPYSSYSHPCSDSYLSPSHNNRSYYRNYDSNRQGRDESLFSNNSRQYESLFNPEDLFNIHPNHIDFDRISRGFQGHRSQNHGEELKKKVTPNYFSKSTTQIPKKSRSIPITTPSDSIGNSIKVNNSKATALDKSQASKKIYEFLRYGTANRKTRIVLSKLLQLRSIQNHLTSLASQNDQLTLTFSAERETPQVLPISKDNKKFLEYENMILKDLDKLDGIDSNGCDIVRERRKEVVEVAQEMLNRLDEEKERQWGEFKMVKREARENNVEDVTVENNNLDNNMVVEKSDEIVKNSISIDDISGNEEIVENSISIDDISGNEESEERKTEARRVRSSAEDIEVDEVENNDITQSPAIAELESLEDVEVEPYIISQDDIKESDSADNNALKSDTSKDLAIIDDDSFVFINTNESMDVDEPFIENNKGGSTSFVGPTDQGEV